MSRSPAAACAPRVPRALLAVTVAASWALLLTIAFSAPPGASAAAFKDGGALHIVVPSGASGNPAGPVGTYVSIQAGSLTPSGTYTLGVALQDAGCQGGFTSLGVNVAADSNGGFIKTFQWPGSVNDTGSSYYICALSQADKSFVQSDQAFTVLGAHSPRIQLARVQPTAGPGTTPPNLPNGVYQAGDEVQISGKDFLPGGTALTAYLTSQQITTAQDVQNATALKTPDGSSISPDDGGNFTAVVTLPQSASPGQYYLYVVSNDSDAGTNTPPALEANRPIVLQPAAAPTATATSTPTAAPTATANTGSTGGTSNTGGGNKTGAIIGLGVTSVILFILGVILLASAATARTEPR